MTELLRTIASLLLLVVIKEPIFSIPARYLFLVFSVQIILILLSHKKTLFLKFENLFWENYSFTSFVYFTKQYCCVVRQLCIIIRECFISQLGLKFLIAVFSRQFGSLLHLSLIDVFKTIFRSTTNLKISALEESFETLTSSFDFGFKKGTEKLTCTPKSLIAKLAQSKRKKIEFSFVKKLRKNFCLKNVVSLKKNFELDSLNFSSSYPVVVFYYHQLNYPKKTSSYQDTNYGSEKDQPTCFLVQAGLAQSDETTKVKSGVKRSNKRGQWHVNVALQLSVATFFITTRKFFFNILLLIYHMQIILELD